jgi:hypothetical protein
LNSAFWCLTLTQLAPWEQQFWRCKMFQTAQSVFLSKRCFEWRVLVPINSAKHENLFFEFRNLFLVFYNLKQVSDVFLTHLKDRWLNVSFPLPKQWLAHEGTEAAVKASRRLAFKWFFAFWDCHLDEYSNAKEQEHLSFDWEKKFVLCFPNVFAWTRNASLICIEKPQFTFCKTFKKEMSSKWSK